MRRIDLKKAQVASINTIRDINRRIVLNYVREREPVSRAELARETGLQRSTISTIIDALVADRMMKEVGEGESTGGRRPTLLRLRVAGATAIGVAITPRQTVIATSDLVGRVLECEQFATNADYKRTLTRVISCVLTMVGKNRRQIDGIGVSLPGLVDPADGTVVYIPYFNWCDLPIAQDIFDATGLHVTIDNDANATALAELWFGSPEISHSRDFIMVLVAEGIGTGIVFDGQVYKGERGAAGEFGHMIVGQNGPVACSCGNYDCWEAFASEGAAISRYKKLIDGDAAASAPSFSQLIDCALGGGTAAQAALLETAYYLGIGISNLVVGLSPEVIVVGGSIARAWPLIAETLVRTIERSVRRGLPPTRILASTLRQQPTLMGALSLTLARKFAFTN